MDLASYLGVSLKEIVESTEKNDKLKDEIDFKDF